MAGWLGASPPTFKAAVHRKNPPPDIGWGRGAADKPTAPETCKGLQPGAMDQAASLLPRFSIKS